MMTEAELTEIANIHWYSDTGELFLLMRAVEKAALESAKQACMVQASTWTIAPGITAAKCCVAAIDALLLKPNHQ